MGVSAKEIYELSAATCTAESKSTGPWAFNNGIVVSASDASKTYQTANGGIKYSVGVQYTITLPEGVAIKYIQMSGYDNYAEQDSYIAEINGKEYSATDIVFPQKTADGTATNVTRDIPLDTEATDAITFTPQGKQVVLTIRLYDYDPTDKSDEGDLTEGHNTNLFFTPTEQMESIDRAPIALPASNGEGIFVSWRFLGTDDVNTKFDVVRNGTSIVSGLSVTNFTDNEGNETSSYEIIVKNNGYEMERTKAFTPWGNIFLRQTLDRPADGVTPGGENYTYSPNDCSIGDVDGDGQYELIVKWDPSNSKDNSQSGYTGNVFLDAYKLDMTSEKPEKLWRIDLGVNIRAGAHYTHDGRPQRYADGAGRVVRPVRLLRLHERRSASVHRP